MNRLQLAGADNGGRALLILNGAATAADGLDGLDDLVRLDIAVGDAAEDDVLAVQPRGDNGGDEELGAVAVRGLAGADGGVAVQQAYVLGPALAMESRKGLLWISLKFSSLNFSP
jgi:hypothetical protein